MKSTTETEVEPVLFDPPISTSNLVAPNPDLIRDHLMRGLSQHGQLIVGSIVAELERQLCAYHHSKHCVTFSTGFWALVASIRLRAIPSRCEVITPSLTYRRLADVVYWAGKKPVFVDCDAESLAMCPKATARAIGESTAMILAVHPIVNCCEVEELIRIASDSEVPIVFDAVESMHESLAGGRVGSFGAGEVFSFHASKLINGVEGGYVCTDDGQFRDQLVHFRTGQLADDQHLGINGELNDMHAAFALAGLAEIEGNVQHNRTIYRSYQEGLDGIDGLRLLTFDERFQTSFKNIVVEVANSYPATRDSLVQRLNRAGALARAHYYPALHAKTYEYEVRRTPTPIAESAMHSFLNLPCGARVTPQDVQRVCNILREIATHGTGGEG